MCKGVKIRMKGRRKKFSKKLCRFYDLPAREKLKYILGPLIQDHPDTCKQDFKLKIPGCKYKFLEVQVCAAWKDLKYPHPSLFLYERKGRYGPNTLFLTLSSNLLHGYLFSLPEDKKTLELVRRAKRSREFVYLIPWQRALEVHTNYLDKETFLWY